MSDFDAQAFLKNLPHRPGVYRMLAKGGELLYVGKAKDLNNRVATYFRKSAQGVRNQSMMAKTERLEVTVTNTEAEALLLENNLIKQHRPRYNVVLKDDKSYPYIYVSTEHEFPRLAFHRGTRRDKGRYFGPYASAGAVRETLNLLQKLFKVRQCEDSFCRNRSRPCLQYQIKRCTAPCVGTISSEEYRLNVAYALQFLEGHSERVIDALIERMEVASARLDFEQAAEYRDRIETIRRVSERQYITGERGNLDIVACTHAENVYSVQVFNIRGGLNLGNTGFFPAVPEIISESRLMTAFLGQYYLSHEVPETLIVSHRPDDVQTLTEMLSRRCGHHVSITSSVRGDRARWLELANRNASHALHTRLATTAGQLRRLEALQSELALEFTPQRMECFDISHTMGEATVASCVVFDAAGPVKSDYRRFNIEGIEPGDDYAAMRQALSRRYKRLKQGEGKMPDLLFVDGGKGQARQAAEVLEELQVDAVMIIAVAKGAGRKPGLETLILSAQANPTILAPHSLALHLIQQIRDEAHRFAITGHRQRRAKARSRSPLEQISGLGPKRRQTLLKHFGGLRGLGRAGVEELSKVPGISRKLAQDIYDALRTSSP